MDNPMEKIWIMCGVHPSIYWFWFYVDVCSRSGDIKEKLTAIVLIFYRCTQCGGQDARIDFVYRCSIFRIERYY